VQCESTTCRNLLASEGLELSESMVFGLGSGLGLNYMERCDRKTGLREPLVFCTAGPGAMARNLGEALGVELVLEETVSRSEARANLFRRLDNGKPYGLKLDRFYLDYVERKAHFNAHYVTACGYDDSNLCVVDVGSIEIRKSTFESIEQARSAKGFMASRNLGLYYEWRPPTTMERAIRRALSKTVADMLYSPSSFYGVKGIEKFAERLRGWRENPNFKYQLMNHYVAWEDEGEARGGFRKLFADFLEETSIVLDNRELSLASEAFRAIAQGWIEVDDLLRQLCSEQDGLPSRLVDAAKAIKGQAKQEAEAYRMIERAVIC
jgi:Domain of unknown function (DUF4872)/Butirosin biosynthesis protein H, N-terminal